MVKSLRMVLSVALISISVGTVSLASASPPSKIVAGLGPKGEIPLDGISDADVGAIAEDSGMSLEDARFILFEGSKVLAEFITANKNDPDFGAVNVVQTGGLRIQLRITKSSSRLVAKLERKLGRTVEITIGGRSAAQLEQDMASADTAIHAMSPKSGVRPRFQIYRDFQLGSIVLAIHPADLAKVDKSLIPSGVILRSDATVTGAALTTWAGNALDPDCTVGYAAESSTGTHAVVTAAHCGDMGATVNGYALGDAQHEICTDHDSQLHTTPNPTLLRGFYNYFDQWTNIHAVAGGWVPGQNFFRRGRFTTARGTISDITSLSVDGSFTDCGWYTVRGFVLTNTSGSAPIPGDSGGPLLLSYFGRWYLAGMLSNSGPAGSQGHSAWIRVPPDWTPCTSQYIC